MICRLPKSQDPRIIEIFQQIFKLGLHFKEAEVWVDELIPYVDVNLKDGEDATPLMRVCRTHYSIEIKLLEYGALPGFKSSYGDPPLETLLQSLKEDVKVEKDQQPRTSSQGPAAKD